MESGETNYCTIEGKDLGTIKKLNITSDGSGNGPGWLPQSIKIEGLLVKKPVTFKYTKDDWVDADTPIMKHV